MLEHMKYVYIDHVKLGKFLGMRMGLLRFDL